MQKKRYYRQIKNHYFRIELLLVISLADDYVAWTPQKGLLTPLRSCIGNFRRPIVSLFFIAYIT